jgi:hypothetical protein
MLAAGMRDQRLEHRGLVERADQFGDHVHQLDTLPLYVAREQVSCLRRKLEESAVTQLPDVATHRPHRVERIPDLVCLLGRH